MTADPHLPAVLHVSTPKPACACPGLLAQEGKPCSGEKLLLMFDRWRKLAKAFYSEKKNQFDISKASIGSAAWQDWAVLQRLSSSVC